MKPSTRKMEQKKKKAMKIKAYFVFAFVCVNNSPLFFGVKHKNDGANMHPGHADMVNDDDSGAVLVVMIRKWIFGSTKKHTKNEFPRRGYCAFFHNRSKSTGATGRSALKEINKMIQGTQM